MQEVCVKRAKQRHAKWKPATGNWFADIQRPTWRKPVTADRIASAMRECFGSGDNPESIVASDHVAKALRNLQQEMERSQFGR